MSKSETTTKKIKALTKDKLFEMYDFSAKCDGYGNIKTDYKKLLKKINAHFGIKS